jgi:hypothetical protein
MRDAAWEGEPPRPLDDPDLFDGVLLRRAFGYGIDVLLLTICSRQSICSSRPSFPPPITPSSSAGTARRRA